MMLKDQWDMGTVLPAQSVTLNVIPDIDCGSRVR